MSEAEEGVCRGRVVLAGRPERLVLRSQEGLMPVEYAMGAAGFQAGDLVEVRLIERDPTFGVTQWSASGRRS